MPRVMVLWTRYSGYSASCWRSLKSCGRHQVRVVALAHGGIAAETFHHHLLAGLDVRLLEQGSCISPTTIEREVDEFGPDSVLVAGWGTPVYRKALIKPGKPRFKLVMGMDTPWRGELRYQLTRSRYWRYLRRVDHVLVAGERSWQYARRLGFKENQISRGLYAWDEGLVERMPTASSRSGWLFLGRYAPEKGLSTLVEAYRSYRSAVASPWPLHCCGSGPLKRLLNGKDGVVDHGFVAPDELPDMFAGVSAFVFPSHYEPWGVALAEAMGCGLPAICTNAVGAAIDLVRDDWNGRIVPTGCSRSLARAMVELHENPAELREMSTNATRSAEAFQSRYWAKRLTRIFDLGT